MSSVGSTSDVVEFNQGATTPKISNPTVGTTEVAIALEANLKSLLFRLRGKTADLQFAFAVGESGTKYVTLRRGAVFHENVLNASGLTLYVQASAAGQTLEVLQWT